MHLRVTGRRGLIAWTKSLSTGRPRVPALQPEAEAFISPESFNSKYLAQSRPGYFPRLVSHPSSPFQWPACKEWPSKDGKLSGLRDIVVLQDTIVEVEISPQGRGYGDAIDHHSKEKASESDWMKVSMPFQIFLDAFIDEKIPWKSGNDQQALVGYLAQQNLFEKSATLAKQCPNLPHTIAGIRSDKEQWRRNVWIGGSNSFTPIHCDPYENLFVQVVGSKRAFLFPPSAASHLHLYPSYTSQPNTSTIPTEDLLLTGSEEIVQSNFPELEKALSDPDTRYVSLEAGDALYIPRGWFNCLRSTSISASVNAWFR